MNERSITACESLAELSSLTYDLSFDLLRWNATSCINKGVIEKWAISFSLFHRVDSILSSYSRRPISLGFRFAVINQKKDLVLTVWLCQSQISMDRSCSRLQGYFSHAIQHLNALYHTYSSLPLQLILTIGTLRSNDADGNRNVKKQLV